MRFLSVRHTLENEVVMKQSLTLPSDPKTSSDMSDMGQRCRCGGGKSACLSGHEIARKPFLASIQCSADLPVHAFMPHALCDPESLISENSKFTGMRREPREKRSGTSMARLGKRSRSLLSRLKRAGSRHWLDWYNGEENGWSSGRQQERPVAALNWAMTGTGS